MNFSNLVLSIHQTHTALQQQASKAVNRSLTIRNWLIGFYIAEFEQKGEDRARYGERLLEKLAKVLNHESFSFRNLKLFRQFYFTYPQIGQSLIGQLNRIRQTPSDEFRSVEKQLLEIGQTASAQSISSVLIPVEKLLDRLSFSHFVELFDIDDPIKRTFYELECMKGTWSVRELRRQINSLYFERSGLSKNPGKLSAMMAEKAETPQPADIIKSVYTFEFLGLRAKEVVEESDLETALLDNLQDFMLELGHGFCLEARQKRILIGNEYAFIDLVFYHRILKCHVLIDLKINEFNHNNAGQLNTYLNYYRKEVAEKEDNPPVGILLVTNKNEALVEYATAGMDNSLFVSKYLVLLPDKEQLQRFIQNELRQL